MRKWALPMLSARGLMGTAASVEGNLIEAVVHGEIPNSTPAVSQRSRAALQDQPSWIVGTVNSGELAKRPSTGVAARGQHFGPFHSTHNVQTSSIRVS